MVIRSPWLALVAAASLLTACRPRSAPSAVPTATGTVRGVVRRPAPDDRPLYGVTVQLAGTSLAAVSDTAGRYVIRRVPPGAYMLEARSVGFCRLARQVRVAAGGATQADLALRLAVNVGC